MTVLPVTTRKKRLIAIIRHLLQPIDQLTAEETDQTLSDISHPPLMSAAVPEMSCGDS